MMDVCSSPVCENKKTQLYINSFFLSILTVTIHLFINALVYFLALAAESNIDIVINLSVDYLVLI